MEPPRADARSPHLCGPGPAPHLGTEVQTRLAGAGGPGPCALTECAYCPHQLRARPARGHAGSLLLCPPQNRGDGTGLVVVCAFSRASGHCPPAPLGMRGSTAPRPRLPTARRQAPRLPVLWLRIPDGGVRGKPAAPTRLPSRWELLLPTSSSYCSALYPRAGCGWEHPCWWHCSERTLGCWAVTGQGRPA